MIRLSGCFFVCMLTVTSIFGQEKVETISLKRAIEEMDRKTADQREITSERGRQLISAKGDKEADAVREYLDQHTILQELEMTRQQLSVLQMMAPAKGPVAQKTMQAWLDGLKKPKSKLPEPPAPLGQPFDFSEVDKHALATPIEVTKSLPQLVKHLIKDLKTDKEKARVIFTWIIENIAFDLDKPFKNIRELQPQITLETRRTNCQGYAMLYEAMGKKAGLDVFLIGGFCRIPDNRLKDPRNSKLANGLYWGSHGWNAIKIDGKYHLIDATFASGLTYRDGQMRPKTPSQVEYFMVPPEALVYSHAPDAPRWQLLKKEIPRKEMESWPLLEPLFFARGFKLRWPTGAVVNVQDSVLVTVEAPGNGFVTGVSYPTDTPGASDQRNFTQVRNGRVEIRAAFPTAGAYDLVITARDSANGEVGTDGRVQTIRVNAKGSKKAPDFPVDLLTFIEKKGYLYEPISGPLTADRPQLFVLSIPDATNAWVESAGKRTRLEKRGELFVGEAKLAAGMVKVGAGFANKEAFYLLEYRAQ